MNSFILYLLKASAGLIIIILPYYFFLRRDSNLSLKRIFLLGGLIISFVFPLFNINLGPEISNAVPVVFLDINQPAVQGLSTTLPAASRGFQLSLESILIFVYLAGIVVLFLRTSYSVLSWLGLKSKSEDIKDNLHYSDRNEVFSLFKTIHLPKKLKESDEHQSILLHEQAHINQLHFIDLLISEVAILLTWFNPFTWLITRMIKENHEHLADREVLSSGINPAHYRAHLLNQTLGVPVFRLGQTFNHSITKKRFDMMKKMKSNRNGLVKVMILLPAIVLSLGFMNISSAQEGIITGKVVIAEDNEPAPGTAIVIKNTGTGTVVDQNGFFELKAPGKSTLVFSFVGYKTKFLECEPGKKYLVKLERDIINLDLDPEVKKGSDVLTIKSDKFTFNTEGTEKVVFYVDGKKVKSIDNINSKDILTVNVYKSTEEIRKRFPDAKDGWDVIEINTKLKEKKEIQPIADIGFQTEDNEPFYIVEEMPKYPGGKEAMAKFIYSNLEYPAAASKKKLKGKVLVQFKVNGKGKVVDIKVIQSSDKIFNSSAIKVVESMPVWKPGKQRGKPVSVQYSVPIVFKPTE